MHRRQQLLLTRTAPQLASQTLLQLLATHNRTCTVRLCARATASSVAPASNHHSCSRVAHNQACGRGSNFQTQSTHGNIIMQLASKHGVRTETQQAAVSATAAPANGLVAATEGAGDSSSSTKAPASSDIISKHLQQTQQAQQAAQARQPVKHPKRRRVDSPWVCPACGNPCSAAGKLIEHMSKCCNDLLTSTSSNAQIPAGQQQQQQSGQQLQATSNSQPQQCSRPANPSTAAADNDPAASALPAAAAAASTPCGDAEVQQLMAAAIEREQALRMWVLRLMHVADPGGGVAPVQLTAAAAAAAAQEEEEADDEDDEDDEQGCGAEAVTAAAAAAAGKELEGAAGTPSAAAAGGLDCTTMATAAATAAPAAGMTENSNKGATAATSSGAHKRRRRKQRPPLRTPEQIADILQLPRHRVAKLIERAPRSIRLVPDSEALQVVYEDAHFLAVLKPPGLRSAPVHRFMGGSALNRMIGYLGYEPHLLHRLDMNTSGVLVAAKDRDTASLAHAQFRDKTAAKAYLALALGVPSSSKFTVDGAIGHHPQVKVARMVVRSGGLPAVTRMQVLSVNPAALLKPDTAAAFGAAATAGGHPPIATSSSDNAAAAAAASAPVAWGCAAPDAAGIGGGACCVCCKPVTGRTHQIRVHMAHAGHPLLGDDVYGLEGPWIPRQALHAFALTLHHPGRGQPVTFTAPAPPDFAAAAAALGLQLPTQEQLIDVARP